MRVGALRGGIVGAAAVGAAVLTIGSGLASAKPMFQMIPHKFAQQPTTAQCQSMFQINCYAAAQLRRAYGVDALNRHGLNGRGETIVHG